MKLLLRGGRVIDPANGIDAVMDVLVDGGKIAAVTAPVAPAPAPASPPAEPAAAVCAADVETIDCAGKLVCPGFVDIHVHLREPGYEYKEDIASGSRAAAAGGFTTICCMPNTDPVIDNGAVAAFVVRRAARDAVVNVLPIGAITKGQAGAELAHMNELVTEGCVGVSDDGHSVMRADIMRHALDYSRIFGIPVMAHCEDTDLSAGGLMHEGHYSTLYGIKGIPAEAEEIMVERDIALARLTGGRLHICHVSTAGSLAAIAQAKAAGLAVTCEVAPHHLALTDEVVGSYDADTKVSPPLRSAEHVEALRQGLASGLVDCIATDHAPHNLESKDCEYGLAASGISGIETAVAVIMHYLVGPGLLSIGRMVELFTTGPARVIGRPGAPAALGTLTPGAPADITVIDPEAVRTVDPRQFRSRGKNTPFKGMTLNGWPCMTVVGGKIVYR